MFAIVDEVIPGRGAAAGAATLARVVVGDVLVVASLVMFLPLALVVVTLMMSWILGSNSNLGSLDATVLAFLSFGLALSGLFWFAGSRLVRGRRRLVVFLRRFGFTPATRALSYAVGGSVGRNWRLVTLDDSQVAPLGVRPRTRTIIRIVRTLLIAGLAALVFFAGFRLKSINGMAEQGAGTSPSDATITAFFETLLLMYPIAVGVVSVMFISVGSLGIRRAEARKAIVFEDQATVDRVAHSIRRGARKVFAPRMVVARVDSDIWQHVVTRLVERSQAIVVDVSQPSDNVSWELDLLAERSAQWIPIGRRDLLELLQTDPSSAASRLRLQLGSREVIGYDDDTLARFNLSLRAALQSI